MDLVKADSGMLSRIQHFSTGDGDGIRTTVFLSGCNLRCPWCHNPETFAPGALVFKANKCALCRLCENICPMGVHSFLDGEHEIDRKKCRACGKCVSVCPEKALELSGHPATVAEIIEEVLHDKDFYDVSGGGVTLSGGDPLCQPGFSAAIAESAVLAGVDVNIETAGCVPFEAFEAVMPYVSRFYFDVKAPEPDGYSAVGGDGALVFANAARLNSMGRDTVARIPVIPGHNASSDDFRRYAVTLPGLGFGRADLMGFHRMGTGKYTELGKAYAYADCEPMERKHLYELADILISAGVDTKVM